MPSIDVGAAGHRTVRMPRRCVRTLNFTSKTEPKSAARESHASRSRTRSVISCVSARLGVSNILFTGPGFVSELIEDPQHFADRSAQLAVGYGEGDHESRGVLGDRDEHQVGADE